MIDFKNLIKIREININDLENLRKWKNLNKNYFFHKEDITQTQQTLWFEKFLKDPNNHMYIVEYNEQPVGCMGFRKLVEEVDAYNIIKGEGNLPKGSMSYAFQSMLNLAMKYYDLPIRLRVLKNNPAVSWYLKNQFVILSEENDFFLMKYNKL